MRALCDSLFVLLALSLCACRQTIDMPRQWRGTPGQEQEQGGMDLRREYYDKGPAPKLLRREVEGLVQRGGAFVKHGRERGLYRSGQAEYERHWVRGEPSGLWQSWWENGTLRSECSFDKQNVAQPMTFWREDGQVEARGMAVNGRRIGTWEFFHANGTLESKGDYVGGERGGTWTFWDEQGSVRESGAYQGGVKVGEWVYR